MYFVDTLLPTDPLFSSHLIVRTPTEDTPLNWTSDDSETENLISTAEEWISGQARPCFVMPVPPEEQHVLRDSAAEEVETEKDAQDELIVPLSVNDLVAQEFDGGIVYKLSPEVLHSLLNSPHQLTLRQRSEPVPSVAGSDDAKLEHQASAPANLEVAATTSDNQESKSIIGNTPSGIPSDSHAPSDHIQQGSTSGGPSRNGDAAVISGVTNSTCPPLELFFPPFAGNAVGHQSPAMCQGTRPKEPPTVNLVTSQIPAFPLTMNSVTSQIPVFVEEQMLSDDEECEAEVLEEEKDDESSSTVIVSLSPTILRLISGGLSGLSGNLTTQTHDSVVTSTSIINISMARSSSVLISTTSSTEPPELGDAGALAMLDFRNNDESVSTSN